MLNTKEGWKALNNLPTNIKAEILQHFSDLESFYDCVLKTEEIGKQKRNERYIRGIGKLFKHLDTPEDSILPTPYEKICSVIDEIGSDYSASWANSRITNIKETLPDDVLRNILRQCGFDESDWL